MRYRDINAHYLFGSTITNWPSLIDRVSERTNLRMFWFLVILFLSLTFACLSEASHDKKLPSAVVVGTVYCDTCFQQDFSMGSHFISGASIAGECKDGNSKPIFNKEVKTNEHGEFEVQLPFSVSKHVKRIKGCTFKLISSSEPYCAVASAATSSSISLKSRKQGEHIFSAGFFSFRPIKKPNICNQKSSVQNSKSVKTEFPPNIEPSFPPPLQDPPPSGGLPPLPRVPGLSPLPQLPPLPPLPGIPLLPPPPVQGKAKESNPTKTSDPEGLFFPPIPFLPPLIPNPFQPPPLIPNPFQPPPLIPNPFQPPPLIPNPFQPPSPPPLIPNPFQPPKPPPLIPNPFQPPSPPPLIPNPFQPPPPSPSPLIPNPFQPPKPTPLIPNPFQPPSPPPLIPNPFQPPPASPSPLFPLPPIPFLTPSPPPPPPPLFSFPFPPLFPPLFPPPRSPGTPPATSSKNISP